MNNYHWGVFTTIFAWEHHLLICDLFRSSFIPLIKNDHIHEDKGLDLGCGSGIWHLLALELLPSIKFDAVDISQTSVDISNKAKALLGFQDQIQEVQSNVVV